MPRPIWSGSISFGLVNIPVKLYSATVSETLDFNMLRKSDLSPIKYVRVARADGQEVPYDEIVKGYEYRKGDYVVLTEEDFQKADVKKTKSITIVDFAKESEIESFLYEKPYFLEPDKGAEKPYALLVEALKRSGKVAVARYVLRNRERLAVIKPNENVLILNQIRYEREIRSTADLNIPDEKVNERELELALTLIDHMCNCFDPKDYHDTYIDELKGAIEEKAKSGEIHPHGEEPQPTEVKNIMDSLKRSLEAASSSRHPRDGGKTEVE